MSSWARRVQVIAGLVVVFVTVSAAVQAVRQGSWGPIADVGWIPAVIVATWPRTYRRCRFPRDRVGGVS
jgi:hypothetical protein